MLRVYLDQNKWIDLARAVTGNPGGDRFRDVLALARACVAAGEVSFPLDSSRYMETSKRAGERSRRQLVSVMAELSRFHTIAPSKVILPAEIDRALHSRFGRPAVPRTASVFGLGAGHALGSDTLVYRFPDLPADLVVPPGYRARAEAAGQELLEHGLLLGRVGDMPEPPEAAATRAAMTQDTEYARYENDLARTLVDHGLAKGKQLDRVMLVTELRDVLPPVLDALGRAGVDPSSFIEGLGQDGLASFLRDLPSRAVTADLRRDKHAQGQQRWERNDLLDIVGLPVAAVYCDVVVTERQWASRMRRAHVDRRYGTRILNDLADLPAVLVAATRL